MIWQLARTLEGFTVCREHDRLRSGAGKTEQFGGWR